MFLNHNLTLVALHLTFSLWQASMSISLTSILTSLQTSITVSWSLSTFIVLEMLENSMQLWWLYCSSFDIWISRILTFFSRLPHTVFWIAKSVLNLYFSIKIDLLYLLTPLYEYKDSLFLHQLQLYLLVERSSSLFLVF